MPDDHRDVKHTLDYASPLPAAPHPTRRLVFGIIGLVVYVPVTILATIGAIAFVIKPFTSPSEISAYGFLAALILLAIVAGLLAWNCWDQIKGGNDSVDN